MSRKVHSVKTASSACRLEWMSLMTAILPSDDPEVLSVRGSAWLE